MTGAELHRNVDHKGGINCVKYDSNTLATCSDDTTVRLYDVRTYAPICVLREHYGCVFSLQLEGNTIMSVCNEGSLVECDLRKRDAVRMYQTSSDLYNVHFTASDIVCAGFSGLFFLDRCLSLPLHCYARGFLFTLLCCVFAVQSGTTGLPMSFPIRVSELMAQGSHSMYKLLSVCSSFFCLPDLYIP